MIKKMILFMLLGLGLSFAQTADDRIGPSSAEMQGYILDRLLLLDTAVVNISDSTWFGTPGDSARVITIPKRFKNVSIIWDDSLAGLAANAVTDSFSVYSYSPTLGKYYRIGGVNKTTKNTDLQFVGSSGNPLSWLLLDECIYKLKITLNNYRAAYPTRKAKFIIRCSN